MADFYNAHFLVNDESGDSGETDEESPVVGGEYGGYGGYDSDCGDVDYSGGCGDYEDQNHTRYFKDAKPHEGRQTTDSKSSSAHRTQKRADGGRNRKVAAIERRPRGSLSSRQRPSARGCVVTPPPTTSVNAVSRAAEIKIAHKHLRKWKRMANNPRNSASNRAWLSGKLESLEIKMVRLYDDEKKAIYSSASTQRGLDKRTSSLNKYWIPKVLTGIEHRDIT